MKRLIYIVFTIIVIACSNTSQKKEINLLYNTDSLTVDTLIMCNELVKKVELDSLSCGFNFIHGKNYKIEKSEITKTRIGLSIEYLKAFDTTVQNNILDSAMLIFTKSLLNKIIPYWYGTTWDFNGYTSKPNQGTIACGYFVSTTLRDMGLNINRYKLAQQGPLNEVKSVAINLKEVLYFEEKNIYENLKSLKEGLYFMGLGFHVGYLYVNNNNDAYFLHSNYIEGKVMVEKIEYSEAFNSTYYYISKITGNKLLMKKWLKKEEIQVIIE